MAAEPGELERWLRESGALLEGHFQLSSGEHSLAYVQCARLLEQPARSRRLGELLAERLTPFEPRSVLSPALGGLIIGHETAAALGVPFRFAERRDGEMRLRRGFVLEPGERLAVVEDVVTTGGSAREVLALARRHGALPVAVGAILDRSRQAPFAEPFVALRRVELPTYDPRDCPACRRGEAAERPGSRA